MIVERHRLLLAASFLSGLFWHGTVRAQAVIEPGVGPCHAAGDQVQVTPLYSDSLSSSFSICIPHEVRPHYHRYHTEHVVVLDGEGLMQLGDSTFMVVAGSAIIIPQGTPHAVRVTSATPLHVISVQSPYFDGTDRVLIEH